MNAHVASRGPARLAVISTANDDGSVEGVARHVSAEGCQFLLVSGMAEAGQQMAFALAPDCTVSGTIRWVLDERIGFAFDRKITVETIAELSAHFAQLKAVRLIPARVPPVAR